MSIMFRPGVNAFADPATGVVDIWATNHKEEQGGARIRQIDNQHPLASRFETVRAIRVQAATDEAVFKLAGIAPTLAHHRMFLKYQDLSQRQTIFFHHFAGEVFECQLTDYEPQRKYLQRGPKGEHFIWTYSLQIDVVYQII